MTGGVLLLAIQTHPSHEVPHISRPARPRGRLGSQWLTRRPGHQHTRPPASNNTPNNTSAPATCDCKGARAATNDAAASTTYLCGDARLGPVQLPTKLPLGSFVATYNRLGSSSISVDEFLRAWTDPATGEYKKPPRNGFMRDVDGNGINGTMQLEVGTLIDRFGDEDGEYVLAASAPFSQRSLPPSNLDTDPSSPDFPYGYHLYRVVRPFSVSGGPIAPWYGQPGLGAQFYTGDVGSIKKLLAVGYIERQDPAVLVTRAQGVCT
ncbi:hypothetical protein NLG97_g9708 [Lecanicillium saksenae]|uniref:Uncharacterized protein n=1 Tax=Lecanicillium saksenae TaxID=468837 RepID=A0ACC1QH31_9HYPO|nr:hypothetical protein NLG97_g9708 [Lecanicillium saksenae]